MFQEEKLSQVGYKTSKEMVKNLCIQTHITVLNLEKNCKSRLTTLFGENLVRI